MDGTVTRLKAHDGTVLTDRINTIADVYFVQLGGSGLIKIGFSTNLNLRFRQLASGHPNLRLLGSVPGTRLDEAKWHRQWAAQRTAGEWFKPSRQLREAIAAATLSYGWTGGELVVNSRNSPDRRRRAKKKGSI